MDDKIKQLKDWIDGSDNVVFFGGAGRFHRKRHTGFPQRGRPL
jgi:hypothetical protein